VGNFRLLLLMLGAIWSLEVQAESQIWLRNHTDEVLTIQTTARSAKPWVEGKQWTPGAKSVQPGEVVNIANFSRKRSHLSGGGATVVARIQPKSGDEHIELRTKVRPSLCGTRLESGAGESASSHVNWTPGEHHFWVVSSQESPFLRRFPFCQGGEERVEFLVEDLDVTKGAPSSSEDGLNVMTYNIWYLLGKPRQAERWKGIPATVTGNDVVVFTEAFKNKYRDLIVTLLRVEYPYITAVLDGPGAWFNGGVFIASKWPFEGLQPNHAGLYQAQQYLFDESECSGEDCFAAKGIQYVTVRKHDRTFHIFATHLQSTSPVLRSSERASAKLMLQTKRVGAWVASKRIPTDQAVLIAGDLNFDGNDPGILARALKNLNAAMPKRVGKTRHSFMMRRPGSKRQALDYVLYSSAHLSPSEATQETVIPPGLLSDHFPVRTVYIFGEE
jgi:endonuclease/exonuclease/phosphatase family metal-dependent hydrolase